MECVPSVKSLTWPVTVQPGTVWLRSSLIVTSLSVPLVVNLV